ncbi:MAG: cupin domain-containing protein [Mucilaginibacter sp.]
MKRNKFITTVLTFAAIPLSPFAATAKLYGHIRAKKGFKIQAGEGRIHGHITLKGVNSNILDVKVSGKDTDGDLAIFEQTSLSPGRGTPLHIHPLQDEIFYVLEGSYFFKVGDDKFHLTAGESIFLPRNVPHGWTQVSEKGKMTVTFQPAGKLEEFFVTMQALDHEPTPAEVAKIFADHEMRVVGPPVKIE